MFGIFSQVQGWVKIKGASDGTNIGNTGDSLKALVTASALPTGASTELTLEAARVLLASINGKDFATQTELAALNAKINSLTSAPATNALGLVVRQVPFELSTFVITAPAVVVGNNKSMISIQNTGTSIVKLREVWIVNDRNTAVTGVAGEFRLHRIASFSGGTALTPDSFDTGDSLPAGITAATNATIATEGALFRSGKWSTDEWGPGTADVESYDHGFQQVEPFWRQTPSCKPITLRQNQGAHVRFATNSTAGEFNLRLVFTTE